MKKRTASENYLERVPARKEGLPWSEKDGLVTLEIENKGVFNRIAQKFFKKPKISYVHLEETGSFVWGLTDGKKSIIELGAEVKERFGDAAEPLYERLAQYFRILESYGFIEWID